MKKIQMLTYTNEYKLLLNNFQGHIELTYLSKLQVHMGMEFSLTCQIGGLPTRSEIHCQSIVELWFRLFKHLLLSILPTTCTMAISTNFMYLGSFCTITLHL
jgi:hypothetical protein